MSGRGMAPRRSPSASAVHVHSRLWSHVASERLRQPPGRGPDDHMERRHGRASLRGSRRLLCCPPGAVGSRYRLASDRQTSARGVDRLVALRVVVRRGPRWRAEWPRQPDWRRTWCCALLRPVGGAAVAGRPGWFGTAFHSGPVGRGQGGEGGLGRAVGRVGRSFSHRQQPIA